MDYIPDDVGKDRSLDRSDIFPEVIRSSHEYSMLRLIPGMYNSCFYMNNNIRYFLSSV